MRLAFNTDPIDESLRPVGSAYIMGQLGITFDSHDPQLHHDFALRVAADNAWRAQTWADYMPGQPNPFVR